MFLYNETQRKSICLYGVTSYGAKNFNCGDPNIPSGSMRASFYLRKQPRLRRLTGARLKVNDRLNSDQPNPQSFLAFSPYMVIVFIKVQL